MQALLQTNAPELIPCQVKGIAKHGGATVLSFVTSAPDYKGGHIDVHSVWTGWLRNKHVGRKHSQYYEPTMGCMAKAFSTAAEAEAYIAWLIEG
ncbi:hypothetical protein [Paracidovorax citrulli]|uniref:hypothetical protein n=1 Tax=Paracidovorax citrulli TaxID=80869 RepID=UPI0005FC1A0A|nr:hypothetical protein [Paracidovorax citrulli]